MADTFTLEGTISSLGIATHDSVIHAYVQSNIMPGDGLLDTTGEVLMLGAEAVKVDRGTGAWSVGLVDTDATDLNVGAGVLLYELVVHYYDAGARDERVYTSGWFELTSDTDFAKLDLDVSVTAVTPALASQIGAAAALGATNDTATASFVNNPASATRAALATTIASERRTHEQGPYNGWKSKLATRGTTRVNIVTIGDSITEGAGVFNAPAYRYRWVDLLHKRLQTYAGLNASGGYAPAYYADGVLGDDTTRSGTSTEVSGRWGLGGRALMLTANTSTVTFPARRATQVRVWYGKDNFFPGNFTVKINGVDVTNTGTLWPGNTAAGTFVSVNNAGGARSGYYWQSAPVTAADLTVVVSSISGSSQVAVEGVEYILEDAASGVYVYDGAHSGAKVTHYLAANMDVGHWDVVALLNPALLLVNLGTNEGGEGIAAATFQANLQSLVTKAATRAPNAHIVLVKGWWPRTVTESLWNQYNAAKDAVAAANSTRVSTFDLAAYWPALAANGSTSQGLMVETTNPVHPNTAGNQRYADIMFNLLHP